MSSVDNRSPLERGLRKVGKRLGLVTSPSKKGLATTPTTVSAAPAVKSAGANGQLPVTEPVSPVPQLPRSLDQVKEVPESERASSLQEPLDVSGESGVVHGGIPAASQAGISAATTPQVVAAPQTRDSPEPAQRPLPVNPDELPATSAQLVNKLDHTAAAATQGGALQVSAGNVQKAPLPKDPIAHPTNPITHPPTTGRVQEPAVPQPSAVTSAPLSSTHPSLVHHDKAVTPGAPVSLMDSNTPLKQPDALPANAATNDQSSFIKQPTTATSGASTPTQQPTATLADSGAPITKPIVMPLAPNTPEAAPAPPRAVGLAPGSVSALQGRTEPQLERPLQDAVKPGAASSTAAVDVREQRKQSNEFQEQFVGAPAGLVSEDYLSSHQQGGTLSNSAPSSPLSPLDKSLSSSNISTTTQGSASSKGPQPLLQGPAGLQNGPLQDGISSVVKGTASSQQPIQAEGIDDDNGNGTASVQLEELRREALRLDHMATEEERLAVALMDKAEHLERQLHQSQEAAQEAASSLQQLEQELTALRSNVEAKVTAAEKYSAKLQASQGGHNSGVDSRQRYTTLVQQLLQQANQGALEVDNMEQYLVQARQQLLERERQVRHLQEVHAQVLSEASRVAQQALQLMVEGYNAAKRYRSHRATTSAASRSSIHPQPAAAQLVV